MLHTSIPAPSIGDIRSAPRDIARRLMPAGSRIARFVRSREQEDVGGLQANTVAIWLLLAAVIVLQVVVAGFAHISLDLSDSLAFNASVCSILALIGLFFMLRDYRPRISLIAGSLGQLVIASIALCMMTYAMTALSRSTPLQDALLASADDVLGFRWSEVLRWAESHPDMALLGGIAYGSIAKQALFAIFLLGSRGDFARLQTAVYAYVLALLTTSVVSLFVPAVGAYAFFDIQRTMHSHVALMTADVPVPTIHQLRDGILTSFDVGHAKGVISFPSFHAALGVLFIWCFWSTPVLRWMGLLFDSVMIAATPLHGSHYLTDVLAGLLIGGVSLLVARRLHASIRRCWGPRFDRLDIVDHGPARERRVDRPRRSDPGPRELLQVERSRSR